MNVKEALLGIETVYNVVVTKNQDHHGNDATKYEVFTKSPVDGNRFVHTMFINDKLKLNTEKTITVITSHLKNWWVDLNG